MSPLKIFFDGGCRPNPGPMEVAVVVRGEARFFDQLGEGSHADAEWLALCLALEVAQGLGIMQFDLLGDSRSIVDQVRGVVPCRGLRARGYRERFMAASAILPPRRIRWVSRRQNLAGIALSRRHDLPGAVS